MNSISGFPKAFLLWSLIYWWLLQQILNFKVTEWIYSQTPKNQLDMYAPWHFFPLACKCYFDPIPSPTSSWGTQSEKNASERNVLEGMMLFSKHKFLNISVHIFPGVISVLTCSTLEWKWSKALLIFMLFVKNGNGWIPQALHFI